jgi:hypothetical protein
MKEGGGEIRRLFLFRHCRRPNGHFAQHHFAKSEPRISGGPSSEQM